MIEVKLNGKNITQLVSSLSFENSIDSLATTISFSVPFHKKTDFYIEIEVGDKIEISKDSKNIFKGMVVEVSINDVTMNLKAMDIGFYLNKNKVLKQVRNTSGNQAIKSICSEIGIPIEVKGLEVKINKVYKTETIADIINDIIKQDTQQSKKEYCIYVLDNKVYVDFQGENEVDISFKLSGKDILKESGAIINQTSTYNIEDLKNSVLVVSNDSNSILQLAKAEESDSISKYGKLQEVIELEAKEVAKANDVALNAIKISGKIKEELSVEIVTDKYIFSGQSLKLNNKKYLIKSTNFNYLKDRFNGTVNLKEMV